MTKRTRCWMFTIRVVCIFVLNIDILICRSKGVMSRPRAQQPGPHILAAFYKEPPTPNPVQWANKYARQKIVSA